MAEIRTRSKKYGEHIILLDDEDYEKLKKYTWCANYQYGRFYAHAHNLGTGRGAPKLKMHILIMKPPKGMVVDHINHNTLDNRRSNLRIVTPHQNSLNSTRDKARTPYLGVYVGKCGFYTQVIKDGVRYRATWFKNKEEAQDMYKKLLTFLLGEEEASIIDMIK